MKAAIFLAEGFEEIEALTPIDLLRRVDIQIDTISISNKNLIKGAHNIIVESDLLLSDIKENSLSSIYDCLILPGGQPGTSNLMNNHRLKKIIQTHNSSKKLIAAICAAPTILGELGILFDKMATCFPACQSELNSKIVIKDQKVVKDQNIITSLGAGTAVDFSLAIISSLLDPKTAENLSKKICYT